MEPRRGTRHFILGRNSPGLLSCSSQPEGLEIAIKSHTACSFLLPPNLALPMLLGLNGKTVPALFFFSSTVICL